MQLVTPGFCHLPFTMYENVPTFLNSVISLKLIMFLYATSSFMCNPYYLEIFLTTSVSHYILLTYEPLRGHLPFCTSFLLPLSFQNPSINHANPIVNLT